MGLMDRWTAASMLGDNLQCRLVRVRIADYDLDPLAERLEEAGQRGELEVLRMIQMARHEGVLDPHTPRQLGLGQLALPGAGL